MNKLLAVLAVALTLVGCEERVVTSTKTVTMEVVNVDLRSKRNSKVDLKVVGTWLVYDGERLRCRKDEARKVRIGSKWDVVVENYRYGNRHGTELKGVDAICTKSQ